MKIDKTAGVITIRTDDDKIIYRATYREYPECCLMGILSSFIIRDYALFEKHKKEIQDYFLKLMRINSINQMLVADTKNGSGYRLVEDMKEANALSVSINNNSGNFVYLFGIYQELE